MDLQGAETAIRRGSDFGFFIAFLLAVGVILASTTNLGGVVDQWNDPWILFDAVLVAGLAWGVRRRSRFCSVGLTTYYVISAINKCVAAGRVSGILFVAIFTYIFAKSIQGTFVYHKLRREQEPEYRAPVKVTRWLLIPGSALLVLYFSLSVVGWFMLPTAVVGGDEMKRSHTALLRERGILLENEQVVMFYSAALFNILGDGNILTNSRVVSYETIGGELIVCGAAYEDIVVVSVVSGGSVFEDTMIGIETASNEQFIVLAGAEAGGDKRFFAELESRIGKLEKVSLSESRP